MADSYFYMAKTNTTLQSSYPPIKNKLKKNPQLCLSQSQESHLVNPKKSSDDGGREGYDHEVLFKTWKSQKYSLHFKYLCEQVKAETSFSKREVPWQSRPYVCTNLQGYGAEVDMLVFSLIAVPRILFWCLCSQSRTLLHLLCSQVWLCGKVMANEI